MKKTIVLMFFVFCLFSLVFAGGIVTNTNQSAAFMRTLNRNASTDVDAAYFNPAGLTKLSDGLHFDISNQSIWQKKTVNNNTATLNKDEFVGDVAALVFPTAYVAYKMDKLVLSAGFMPIGGGGSAEYEDGLPLFEYTLASLVGVPAAYFNSALSPYGTINGYDLDVHFSGSSVYYGFQGGVSYKINDLVSMSLGGRYVIAKNSYEGYMENIKLHTSSGGDLTSAILGSALADVEVDAERSGSGMCGILGVNLSPNDNLNIGIRYETITKLEMENETATGKDGGSEEFTDGAKFNADIPSQLAVGLSYKMSKLKLMSDFNYFGNTGVDWDGDEANFDNSLEFGLGAEYKLTEKLLVSAGYLKSTSGAKSVGQSDLDFNLDSWTVGAGLRYSLTPSIAINIGALNTFYTEAKKTTGTITEKYNQTTFGFAFGLQASL